MPSWTFTHLGPPVEGHVLPDSAPGPEVALPTDATAAESTIPTRSTASSDAVSAAAETHARAAGTQPTHPAQPMPAVTHMPPAVSADARRAGTAPPPRRGGRWLLVFLGLLALTAVATGVGWFIGNQNISTTTSNEVAGSSGEGDPGDATAGGAADGSAAETGDTGGEPASPTTEVTVATSETTETTGTTLSGPFVVPETPDNPSGAARYAVVSGTTAIMRGWYPTAETAQQAVADAARVMGGMQNVRDETQIDPRADVQPDRFAIYFENHILFETDSAEITPGFYELLAFPLVFMMTSPQAEVTVVARTDASGPVDYNLELATRRAEAVRDYWLANGGNAEQIVLDPRGEEGARDDATDEEAALDRRVELQVSGFLGG